MVFSRKWLLDAALVATVAVATTAGVVKLLANSALQLSEIFPRDGIVLIGHALGGIDGKTYTNSREAFLNSVRTGRRILEVDLQMVRGGHVVAFHDDSLRRHMGIDKRNDAVTLKEFLSYPIQGAYTPLSFKDLLDLLQQHPDLVLVTDTKRDTSGMLAKVKQLAESVHPALLDRIVPQIYNEKDLERVNRVHRFPAVIFTLYRTSMDDEHVLAFARREPQVAAVTMSHVRFSTPLAAELRAAGKDVFVHTLNDPEQVRAFVERGASGVYTDFLLADDLTGIQ